MIIIAFVFIIIIAVIIAAIRSPGGSSRKSGYSKQKREKPAEWLEDSRFFSDSDFICSRCRKKADRPYEICHHCGARIGRIRWEDRDLHDWLDANPGCDEIDYEEWLECDIYDDD